MLLHVLGHVDADHRLLVAEQELGERAGELGLADAGGAEEDERAGRALRVLDPGARAADRLRDGGDRRPPGRSTRLCSSSSMRTSFLVSASVSLKTGMPVHIATMSAISSSPTSGRSPPSPEVHSSSSSRLLGWSAGAPVSRRFAAFSNSWASIAASLSRRVVLDLLLEVAVDGRLRHRLDAQPRGGLVDQVDRLVGQEAVGDVAVGELGGGLAAPRR